MSDSNEQLNVLVVGAGAAGLAAARRLQSLGHHVEIFEARDDVGGQVVTFDVGGEPLECFYHHLFTNDVTAVRFFEELGLGDRLQWYEPLNAHFVKDHAYPFTTPLDLLRFDAVSFIGRLRLGLSSLWLRRKSDWTPYEDITAREYLIRAVGKEAFDAFWGPLLKGKFSDYSDDIGMAWLQWKIRLRFGSRGGRFGLKEILGYPNGSFRPIYERLANDIQGNGGKIYLNERVEAVVTENNCVKGISSGGNFYPADRVLLTTPNPVTKRLVSVLPSEYVEVLDRVQYQWASCLVLALDRPLTEYYWLSIADSLPFVACVEHTNLVPKERYDGNHIVYLSNYVPPGHPLLEMDAGEALKNFESGIRRLNPEFDISWVRDAWLFSDPAGQPVITTNYSNSIPSIETGVSGLTLANTTQIYPEDRGQNYSFRLGERAAEVIDERS